MRSANKRQKEGYIRWLNAEAVACLIRPRTWPLLDTHMRLHVWQGKTAIDFCKNKQAEKMILRAGPVAKRLRAWKLQQENRRRMAETRVRAEQAETEAKEDTKNNMSQV